MKLLSIISFTSWLASSQAVADIVRLSTQDVVSGTLVGMEAGFVQLQLPEVDGEAFQRIPPSDIASLVFEDEAESLEYRALRRSKFQPLLAYGDAELLPKLLQQYLDSGNSLAALSYAKLWHPKNPYATLDESYRRILVEAALQAKLTGEALTHAQNWLSRDPKPYGEALPWTLLAKRELKLENPEAALWLALEPIARASETERPKLAPLYTLAAIAYRKIGYSQHAQQLLSELEEIPSHASLPPIILSSLDQTALSFSTLLQTQSSK